MTSPDDLLADIIANPADDAARLIYADWLDGQGHSLSVDGGETGGVAEWEGVMAMTARTLYVQLDAWASPQQQAVEVIGETKTRYRIRAIKKTRLGGCRYLQAGDAVLVPMSAVRGRVEGVEVVGE